MSYTPKPGRVGMLVLALLMGGCGTSCPHQPKKAPVDIAPQSSGGVDGARALSHVERIVALGPRPPGSDALEKTRQYIESCLRSSGLSPRRHPFTARTPHPRFLEVEMANITVDITGTWPGRVMIGGHFDGKLLDGMHFVGANDGGSSTALLLELGRLLASQPPPCHVTLAFFDGEEALVEWSDRDGLYGSKNLALEWKVAGKIQELRAMVVVDMIGDVDLHLFRETLSTPWVQHVLIQAARETGYGDIWSGPRASIEDDHLPFLQSGVPAANMIDLAYGSKAGGNEYWHTEKDTPDKLSAASLKAVGDTVLAALPRLCEGPPDGRGDEGE